MCESTAYFRIADNSEEELILEEVALVIPVSDNEVYLKNIFGEEKTVKGRIKEIQLVAHKIILSKE